LVLVNPPSRHLGRDHVILNGIGRDYHVSDFPGPLSIKSVLSGVATWQTSEGRFEIGPGSSIVINDGQPYCITVQSRTPVETLCIFFARGFVEDIYHASTTPEARLVDDPQTAGEQHFPERIRHNDHRLLSLLHNLRGAVDPEEAVLRVGEALTLSRTETMRAAANIPATRPSTRYELATRVHRARNMIEGSLDKPLTLEMIAREAALSPFHLHRSFRRLFGETPHDYLTRRRIERATTLLKSTEMPVTDVCYACGFQSLGSFSTLFRKRTGASPVQFRTR
jgi:AraC-like DNA-binding protein